VVRGDISSGARVISTTETIVGTNLVSSRIHVNPSVDNNMQFAAASYLFTDQSLSTVAPVPFVGYADVSNFYINTTSGNKVSLKELLPNWVHKTSWYAMDGEWIAKPTCAPGGVTRVVVVPQSTPTNIYNPPAGWNASNRGASFAYAVDMGGAWVIRNYPYYNYTASGSALANTYCVY
jgi:hypothetical protein